MNRNVESHFAMLPRAEIQRSRFDRSFSHKTTFNVGDVVPIFLDMDILPGDTVTVDTSKVIRLQTLLKPIFDNVYLDTYFFFVPNRLLWSHWKEFMGENTSSAWAPTTTYSIPQMMVYSSDVTASGTLVDYLGVPVGIYGSFNALPIRAYSLICNEWFRDENLTNPLVLNTGDANTTYVSTGDCEAGGALFKASKYHDYFTSCLPAPLKANQPVLAPISSTPGIIANVGMNLYTHENLGNDIAGTTGGNSDYPLVGHFAHNGTLGSQLLKNNTNTGTVDYSTVGSGGSESSSSAYRPDNLYAYIPKTPAWPSGITGALSVSIADLRNAFQIQKLLERDARSGTRYTEVISAHFNTTSPDSRLQRPEYLGGSRVNISVHQVTNQSEGTNQFLGSLGAFGMTVERHSDFTYSATEHGIILGVCVARYDHTYSQGIERGWLRKNRFDYFWPALSTISEQPVYTQELYVGTQITALSTAPIFGYQEAWADYRYKPNRVSGEMRPDVTNTLAVWHLGDDYAAQPYLSDSWIREDKTNVDRVLAVQSSVSNQIMLDVAFNAWYTRPMPMYSIPGLVDHF